MRHLPKRFTPQSVHLGEFYFRPRGALSVSRPSTARLSSSRFTSSRLSVSRRAPGGITDREERLEPSAGAGAPLPAGEDEVRFDSSEGTDNSGAVAASELREESTESFLLANALYDSMP